MRTYRCPQINEAKTPSFVWAFCINKREWFVKKDVVVKLHASFEELVQRDEETGGEYWLARDLQGLLGYAKWENFVKVIEKAKTACQASGFEPADHFLDVRKMVELGSGATREIEDIALTRYACYLIAQNGEPSLSHHVTLCVFTTGSGCDEPQLGTLRLHECRECICCVCQKPPPDG
jgi:hypothetical protein